MSHSLKQICLPGYPSGWAAYSPSRVTLLLLKKTQNYIYIYKYIKTPFHSLNSLAISTASFAFSATLNLCTWRPLSAINFLLWNS